MYGKHFASTYTGSMVGAGINVFGVWGYVIANTVKSYVELNPKLLAMILGCSEAEITQAIDYLTAPDPRSRNKSHEGRRLIREGEFLYLVPTYESYRSILNQDERREYNRVKQAESRARRTDPSRNVKEHVNDLSAVSAHTDTEVDTEVEVSVSSELQQTAFKLYGEVPILLGEAAKLHGEDVILQAMSRTQSAGKRTWPYTEAILRTWVKEGPPESPKEPVLSEQERKDRDNARRMLRGEKAID